MSNIDPMVVAGVWFMMMGVWPLADPGHDGDTPASMLDIALHVAAAVFLIHRWVTR